MRLEPSDPNFEERVRRSFSEQKLMETIGASLLRVAPGEAEIHLPYNERLTQQNGFLHAGIVATILDNACGYAAFSLMPTDASVLSVEFKTNFCSPAIGEEFVAKGLVKKAGRTLMITSAEAHAIRNGQKKLVALMQATMMTVYGRGPS